MLVGFLPGPLAGQAVLDILTGRFNPSAKLPLTYPKYEDGGGIPYMHAVSDKCTKGDPEQPLPHFEYAPCEVQWPFGHGLSYTTFEYEGLRLSTNILAYRRGKTDNNKKLMTTSSTIVTPSNGANELTVGVTVINSGARAGAETILVFSFDEFRGTTPEYKQLRAFEKVFLQPGQSKYVNITIPLDDFRFVGPHDDSHYILQDGLRFRVGIGAETDCRSSGVESNALCSDPITISLDENYVAACEAACNVWESSGCMDTFHMATDKCWSMCSSIHQDTSGTLQMNNDGWYVK